MWMKCGAKRGRRKRKRNASRLRILGLAGVATTPKGHHEVIRPLMVIADKQVTMKAV